MSVLDKVTLVVLENEWEQKPSIRSEGRSIHYSYTNWNILDIERSVVLLKVLFKNDNINSPGRSIIISLSNRTNS